MRAHPVEEGEAGVAYVPNPHRERTPELKVVRGEWRYDQSRFIKARRTHRDDPLGQMYDRRQITEPQYQAGREWQEDYEAAGVGRIKPQDPCREPVDGGGRLPEGVTDRQLSAADRLRRWRWLLGEAGHEIVVAILAEKQHINMVARARYGMVTAANVKMAGWRFRECLQTLAKGMGYAS